MRLEFAAVFAAVLVPATAAETVAIKAGRLIDVIDERVLTDQVILSDIKVGMKTARRSRFVSIAATVLAGCS